jgi:SAM-dependent methyltransferase
VEVLALDGSEKMIEVARHKAAEAGVEGLISFARGDLGEFALPDGWDASVDGVLSNFGALNCVHDLPRFARRLLPTVRVGGLVVLVVMGPVCPWEIVWYLMQGRPKKAFRRFTRTTEASVGHGESIRIHYPGPGRLTRAFGPQFRLRQLVGIGSLLPPPYLHPLVEERRRFYERLAGLESRLGAWFPLNRLNDHYLAVLERV